MRKLLLATAAFGLLAAAPAAAQPFRGLPCVRHNDVYNFHPVDDNHLILENGRHQRVMARLVGVCPGLNFALGIRIKSVGGISGLSCIERGDEVLVNDAGFRGRCTITEMTAYDGPIGDRGYNRHHHDDRDYDDDDDRDNGRHHHNGY